MPNDTPDASGDNPILRDAFEVPFAEVRAEHVQPALRAALAEAERASERVRSATAPLRYGDTLAILDAAEMRLRRTAAIVAHLNNVRQDPAFREAWSAVVPELAAFEARQASDPEVYRVLSAYAASEEATTLDASRARHLQLTLDAMRRAGAGLDETARARAEKLQGELATLANRFQNNVLDGTNAFSLDVEDEARLAGIPASARTRARRAAESAGVDGWRFTLQQPSYLAVTEHAEDRELRRTMYEAFQARGTGEGRDNRELIPRILRARRELADLLGYAHWADLQTEPRMAGRGATAQAFERDLFARVEPHFRREVSELGAFARERLEIDRLEPWDVRFAFERMRRERFELDDEELRPWFPLDRVQAGLFELAGALFGVEIRPAETEGAWHEDVAFYEVLDEDGRRIGAFYTDWFPRDDKRSGAWMMPLSTGGPSTDGFEPHLGAVSGNLTPPDGDRPALLTHDEVRTVFHEFGHLLHHLLSRVEVRSLSGTQVPWDFVELPSQLFENWLWEDEALVRIARHVDDGSPLPASLRERMRAARTFGAAHHMSRQLSFGTVDLALHVDFAPEEGADPLAFGRDVLAPFQIRPDAVSDGFLPAFSHIFAGGYAAGYYSYLWSEMLEADAFRRFREEGLYDAGVGRAFLRTILSRGNEASPDDMVRAFLGREPDAEALLVRNLGLGRRGVGAA
ncbi:MAG: M3 family peptidase [Deinococcus-Thermus bacterium]|jgi:oligopeptidase A|nr:M3 family peptidase [Deinococcota bacterium]